jgi:hypothetical protein
MNCNPMLGQKDTLNSRFSLSSGLSYNTLYWETYDVLNQETHVLKRNSLWLQPNFRISYKLDVIELENNANLGISIFTGYNSFGGKSKTEDSGYKDYYIFRSIEFGFMPCYSQNRYNGFIGIKGQYIFNAKSKAYGSLVQDPNEPRDWSEEDVGSFFKSSSVSFGIGGKYNLNRFFIGIESWFGINNFGDIEEASLVARENNFRIFLGINF